MSNAVMLIPAVVLGIGALAAVCMALGRRWFLLGMALAMAWAATQLLFLWAS